MDCIFVTSPVAEVDISTSIGVQGDGYVELSGNLLPHTNDQAVEDISLLFRTDEPNGKIYHCCSAPMNLMVKK